MTPTSQPALVKWWIAHPLVGFIGSLASVLSIPLAGYFFYASQASRELTVTSDPPVTIVKGGQASSVDVRYHGNPITTDVYARTVYVWNGGNESIRTVNVLEAIEVTITNATILETRLRRLTRPLTKMKVKQDGNKILLDWSILEHNDGAAIDIVYAATGPGSLQVRGAIEHQSGLRFAEYETPRASQNSLWLQIMVYLVCGCFGIFMSVLAILIFRNLAKDWKTFSRGSVIGGVVIGSGCFCIGCLAIFLLVKLATLSGVTPPVF
jgi:hypothetical protein